MGSRTKPPWFYTQSCAVPFRHTEDGEIEILLIRNRKNTRWIAPKGIVDQGLSPAQSAAKEAWEESGAAGSLYTSPLGEYEYSKWGATASVTVFGLKVSALEDSYPEAEFRKRRWFSLKDASTLAAPEELSSLFKKLPPKGDSEMPTFQSPRPKILTLMRHAKSSWKDLSLSDFDRPLNGRGKRDAPMMGERLVEYEIRPDLIVSSPAKRARKTAKVIAGRLGYPEEKIEWEEEIYEASCQTLLRIVRSLPEDGTHAMLFGHNPGFTDLACVLTGESIYNVPTSGVVSIAFEQTSWREIQPGTGEIALFDFPKNERSLY